MNGSPADAVPEQAGWRGRLIQLREKFGRLLLIPQLSAQEARLLRQRILDGARLDSGYVLMCALSAGIAILGLLQSSTAVVIGAMLVSPLMGPIAALGIAFASLDGKRIRAAATSIAAGAAIGITTGMILTWISPISDVTPEILGRTQPNLLDLGVALLSGLAGGYATMMAKGETAIGVAIATALMPPLSTVGYGLGTMNLSFALGAMLLFLTNLSAIAFAFAVVARLSGAARLARSVEWSWRHTAVLIGVFLILAVPLAMTMTQVKRELNLRSVARANLVAAFGQDEPNIAQLDVKWPMFDVPHVRAVTISDHYLGGLEGSLRNKLVAVAGRDLQLELQQVLASSSGDDVRAVTDTAMERGFADFVANGPPLDEIRAKLGIPVRSISSDRRQKVIYVEPYAAEGWELSDFRALERRVAESFGDWSVNLLPPLQQRLRFDVSADGDSMQTVIWALKRWAIGSVDVQVATDVDQAALTSSLSQAGITAKLSTANKLGKGQAEVEVVHAPARGPSGQSSNSKGQ